MPERSVSVVVPCRNEEAHIGRLLAAIGAQSVRPDDIVIVDGGSTDDTLGVISEAAARLAPIVVRTIVAPDDRLPAAINRAVREARGDVIVRLDGHSSPPPDYIARAVSHLADPKVGVVGGIWQIVPGDDTPMGEGIARAVSHPLGAGDAAYRIRSARTVTDMDTVPFGCFTRATWQLVGGLNESLLGNEDYEFNYRVRRAGLAVRLDPMMHSTYVARASLGALALQYFRYGWCKMQMLRQHPTSLRWRQTLPVAFVAGLLVLALAALFVRPAALMLGLVVLAYLTVLTAASVWICAREKGWNRVGALVTAFATIHLCWGAGALTFLATSGRWPDRRFLFGQRAAL
jgi:glycosyltransferase involved in cell wall biosynthesis